MMYANRETLRRANRFGQSTDWIPWNCEPRRGYKAKEGRKKGGWVRKPGRAGLLIVDGASWRGENPICQAICPATQNLNRKTYFEDASPSERKRAREREREREGGGRLCPRAVGDSKSGSAIISEGESEIRSSNRISRGQTLSVTKPASILGYRCPFNVSDPGSKETSSLWYAKFPATVRLFRSEFISRLIGSRWKRQELFELALCMI